MWHIYVCVRVRARAESQRLVVAATSLFGNFHVHCDAQRIYTVNAIVCITRHVDSNFVAISIENVKYLLHTGKHLHSLCSWAKQTQRQSCASDPLDSCICVSCIGKFVFSIFHIFFLLFGA